MKSDTNSATPSNWPANILAAMMFLIPAAGVPNEFVLQDSLKSSILGIGTFLAALFFFWRGARTDQPLHWHAVLSLLLVLAAYALTSMLWSHAYLGAGEAIRWYVIFVLALLCINVALSSGITRVLWGMHWGGVMASVWVALQYWHGLDWFPQAAYPASTFANRNFFAEYAVCALPYSIWLFLQATSSRWASLVAMSLALCLVGLLAAGTRSALIALSIFLVLGGALIVRIHRQLHIYTWPRTTKISSLIAFIAVLLVFNSIPSADQAGRHEYSDTLALRVALRASSLSAADEYTKGSFSDRVVMWKATARMTMANPLTGVGAGAWEVFIPLYQDADTSKEFDYFAHNDVFQLLSEYGLIVGGLFCAFFAAFILKWAGSTWSGLPAMLPGMSLRACALGSILVLLVVAGAGFPLHLAPCCALLGLSIGILGATDRQTAKMGETYLRTVARSSSIHRIATGVAAMSLLAAMGVSVQAMRAESKMMEALVLATDMVNAKTANTPLEPSRKFRLLDNAYSAIDINPHLRKLAPIVADRLAAAGELEDAVKIWRSSTESRPHVAALWSNLALGYSNLGQHAEAQAALEQFKRLRPTRPENISIEITLRRNAGDMAGALQQIRDHFRNDNYDFSIVQTGYETAVLARDWPLAIEALERRNESWPELMANGWLQLGLIYSRPEVNQPAKAQAAFRAGLLASKDEFREAYRQKVPLPYRDLL